jgi:electron transfer flavoprotein alpha subunit
MHMTGEIVVVVEALRGEVCEITYTMLAAGRQLADGLGTKLTALVLGQETDGLLGTLGVADRAVCVEHAALAEFNPEAYARVMAAAFEAHQPRLILFGNTAMGTDLACAVAQAFGLPIASTCKTFAVDGGAAQYTAVTCGGKLIATGPLPEPTAVVTVMPGGYRADDGRKDAAPAAVEKLAPPADVDGVRTTFKTYIEPPTGDVDIGKEAVLISVGRGIQNQDNLQLAERLASAVGGVVSASRPVVDQGWLPTTRLVGKSGKQVKPKLYLAIGISGAPEHMEGVPEADLMIAVNTDEQAPIFDMAHYGTTCDALELMPALAEVLGK